MKAGKIFIPGIIIIGVVIFSIFIHSPRNKPSYCFTIW